VDYKMNGAIVPILPSAGREISPWNFWRSNCLLADTPESYVRPPPLSAVPEIHSKIEVKWTIEQSREWTNGDRPFGQSAPAAQEPHSRWKWPYDV